MSCFVRIGNSAKTGKKFYALVVKYAGGEREKYFFGNAVDFLSLLNISPVEFYVLPCGDYAIK